MVTIDDLERKAEAAGVSMPSVLDRAGVAQTTFWRWRERGVTPRLDTYNKLLAAIDELGREPRS